MPLYEVVLEQRFFNQICINRWNYVGSGTPASVTGSFGLLSAMGFIPTSADLPTDSIGEGLQNLQNSNVLFVQATARAIYEDTDFYANPFYANTLGASPATGDAQSPLVAFGARSSRVKQSIGRGYKRFVGVTEGDTELAGQLNVNALARFENLRQYMSDTLTFDDEGNTLTFTPCISQKEKYETPGGKNAYRYYSTELLQAPHNAVGILWEMYPNVRSQVSRQYGRGV